MKKGDKIEFTDEQRNSMLHLFSAMVLTADSAERAEDRASMAHRTMWKAIADTVGLDRTFSYRLLPGFRGVEMTKGSSLDNLELDVFDVLNEWDNIKKILMKGHET